MKTKIIYSDNGTLTDLTAQLNDYDANTQAFTFVAAEDAIFLGSIYPFTSKYFKQTSVNSSASAPTISYWDGGTWRAASDFTDNTGLSGTPYSASGYLSFVTDKRYTWYPDDTNRSATEQITGLGDKTFYDLYWIRITYSSDIAMTLSWCGDMFCTDLDLKKISPSVMDPTFMDNWESGKTGWEDQRVLATELLIEELKGVKLDSENLFLDKDELTQAASYRTLSLIYAEMEDFDKAEAFLKRAEVLSRQSFTKDTNLDGRTNPSEVGIRPKRMVR